MKTEVLLPVTAATTEYQYSNSINIDGMQQCSIEIEYSKGGGTTYLYIIIEYSHDLYDWYVDQLSNIGASFNDMIDYIRRFANGGNKSIQFPVSNMYLRVGFKVDAGGSSTVGIRACVDERNE